MHKVNMTSDCVWDATCSVTFLRNVCKFPALLRRWMPLRALHEREDVVLSKLFPTTAAKSPHYCKSLVQRHTRAVTLSCFPPLFCFLRTSDDSTEWAILALFHHICSSQPRSYVCSGDVRGLCVLSGAEMNALPSCCEWLLCFSRRWAVVQAAS